MLISLPLFLLLIFGLIVESLRVSIEHNGPVIVGGTITIKAELSNDDGSIPSGKYHYMWEDNAVPPHKGEFKGEFTSSVWNVTYAPPLYSPGSYEAQVVVAKVIFFDWNEASNRTSFNITPLLNGKMVLLQNGTQTTNDFVSNTEEVEHKIKLGEADLNFISTNSTKVTSYWFVDCQYQGMKTNDPLEFRYNFTKGEDKIHDIKALLVASPESLEKKAETNEITTEASKNLTTDKPPSTTVPPPTVASVECPDSSFVPPDPNKTYGYFKRTVNVQTPVQNIVVSGTDWLKHGDVLNLNATCSGSPPYLHCVKILTGEYNTSGEETCTKFIQTNSCNFTLTHYFSKDESYTILFIIANSVSKTVTPVRVNVYEVRKLPQLSVIVVPVTCTVIAVVLIVFGVAYYIQSRNRYKIEVADFDFSQLGNDTEYKTFRERLRDAVSNTLNRSQDYSDDGGGVWSPSRKYGSMQ